MSRPARRAAMTSLIQGSASVIGPSMVKRPVSWSAMHSRKDVLAARRRRTGARGHQDASAAAVGED